MRNNRERHTLYTLTSGLHRKATCEVKEENFIRVIEERLGERFEVSGAHYVTTDGFVSRYYSWSSERKGLAGMPKQLKSVGTNQFFMQ